MRRWIIVSAGLTLMALMVGLAPGAAAGALDDVKKRGKLVAGVKTDFPPFGYVDAQGKNLGYPSPGAGGHHRAPDRMARRSE